MKRERVERKRKERKRNKNKKMECEKWREKLPKGESFIISTTQETRGKGKNRSPKGNMWSAIPVALLCMTVNLCEG